MKIRETYGMAAVGAIGARKILGIKGAASVAAPVRGDSVEVSARSHEVQRARLVALAAPEVRHAEVEAILGDLTAGRYAVTGAQVVPRLLQDHFQLSR